MSSAHRTLDSSLAALENEAIYVMREVHGQFEKAVLLFSGGKDSIVLAHLAVRAFAPARMPFTLLHIDTGHNFVETLEFRDQMTAELNIDLKVKYVQELIDAGKIKDEPGPHPSRNVLQTPALLEGLAELKADAAIGGARRDEEKARAKERFFSHRDRYGQWNPKDQRPELWKLFNGRKHPGESFRVFPLSNWTELDIWRYIQARNIPMPSLYFSHERNIIERNGVLYADTPYTAALPGEKVEKLQVRFRTIGDATCTGAVISKASNVYEVVQELMFTRLTERSTRNDDKRSSAAMEDRKKDGYF